MNVETPEDLLAWQLHGLYRTEQQLVDVLDWFGEESSIDALDDRPDKAAKTALAETFREHREQTREHVERLEAAFDAMNRRPEGRDVPSTEGIATEAHRFTNVVLNDALRGPYFVDAAMRVERVEITAYERAIELAERLSMDEAVTDPLRANLADEEAAVEALREHATRQLERLDVG